METDDSLLRRLKGIPKTKEEEKACFYIMNNNVKKRVFGKVKMNRDISTHLYQLNYEELFPFLFFCLVLMQNKLQPLLNKDGVRNCYLGKFGILLLLVLCSVFFMLYSKDFNGQNSSISAEVRIRHVCHPKHNLLIYLFY